MNGLGRNKEEKENKSLLFTKETFGVVLILFATLLLVCLITRDKVFSVPGRYVNSFLFGLFGFFSYFVTIGLIFEGVLLVCGKKTGISTKNKFLLWALFILVALISHIATCKVGELNYGQYISESYKMGANGIKGTSAGGAVTAIIAYVFPLLLSEVGSYVVLGILASVVLYFTITSFMKGDKGKKKKKEEKFRSSYVADENKSDEQKDDGADDNVIQQTEEPAHHGKQRLFVNNPDDFAFKKKKEIKDQEGQQGLKINKMNGGLNIGVYPTETVNDIKNEKNFSDEYQKKLEYIKTPVTFDANQYIRNTPSTNSYSNFTSDTKVSDYVNRTEPEKKEVKEEKKSDIPFIEHENKTPPSVVVPDNSDTAEARAERFGNTYAHIEETEEQNVISEATPVEKEVEPERDPFVRRDTSSRDIFKEKPENDRDIPYIDETEEDSSDKNSVEQPAPSNITHNRSMREIFEFDKKKEEKSVIDETAYTSRVAADNNQFPDTSRGAVTPLNRGRNADSVKHVEQPVEEAPKEEPTLEEPPKPEKKPVPINRHYNRPPLDLLETYKKPVNVASENHEERMEIIQRTLEEFHINATCEGYVQGPSITRYEIMMPAGVSVRKVLNYDDDLRMRLSARDGVRIEAPIPGKNLVGVEVANNVKVTVGLREVLEGVKDKEQKGSELVFALGKDIVGNSITDRLEKGPHYLVAGATGSGKSICLHVMIISLLMRYSPEDLRLVLVDPKSNEFMKYEHIPHLLTDEIITEPKRAIALLQWAYEETTRRNELFTSCGGMVSNIDEYNSQIANDKIAKLPRIVFVIDELADLMEACKKELEEKIRRIAAKSRSAGIHLVLATQRPSVDVITGTIKANLPSRIALKVMGNPDSMTILGTGGAEKLLGKGDMLYKNSSMGDYERYQGAFISNREIANVVNYVKENNEGYFDDDIKTYLDNETNPKQEEMAVAGDEGDMNDENSELFKKALALGINYGEISISQLRRRFQIGYPKAGGLIDKMERMKYITPFEGSKARKVLISREKFEELYGPMDED